MIRVWQFLAGNSKAAPLAVLVAVAGSIALARAGSALTGIFFAFVAGIGFVASAFEKE